jgi:hypothetical protein
MVVQTRQCYVAHTLPVLSMHIDGLGSNKICRLDVNNYCVIYKTQMTIQGTNDNSKLSNSVLPLSHLLICPCPHH